MPCTISEQKITFIFAGVIFFALLDMILTTSDAAAFELDTLIPAQVPGYGSNFSLRDINHLGRVDHAAGFDFGGVTVNPELDLNFGYDTAPNGAAGGSAVLGASPSVIIQDQQLGLGIFAAGNFTHYPENTSQTVNGGAFAFGEKAVLPREVLTLAGAYIATQETGFALTTLSLPAPVPYQLSHFRAADAISFGLFTFTPSFSATNIRFNQMPSQNSMDYRESLQTEFAPDGNGKLVLLLHAAQERFADASLNTNTNAALLGIEDQADGLWTLRLLGGAAIQSNSIGQDIIAPVLEGALDWMPSDLDRVRLNLSHEIDDPDEISTQPYTLSEARVSITHQYLRNLDLDFSTYVQNAAYLHSPLKETLVGTDAAVEWRLSAVLALRGDYAFTDRQANYLRAANEHVLTFGVAWTP